MLDGLVGLRHHPVVGGDDEHHDVGDVGAAGAHRGEGGVTGGVDEGDQAAVLADLVGTDLLGDATGLTGGDPGLSDGVEQRGLAMVDVAEHGDPRRPRAQAARRLLAEVEKGVPCPRPIRTRRRRRVLAPRLEAEVIGRKGHGVEVERLVGARHDPVAHQVLDELGDGDRQPRRQVFDGERGGKRDLLQRGDDGTSGVRVDSSAATSASASIRSGVVRKARMNARRRRACTRQVVPVSRQM